jgi:L-lactate dehydrogenase complex protein LldG
MQEMKNDFSDKKEISSREIILRQISSISHRRKAESNSYNFSGDKIYKEIVPDAISCFQQEIRAVAGECFVFENEADLFVALKEFVSEKGFSKLHCRDEELKEHLNSFDISFSSSEADFETMEVGITRCEFLVARTGSVIVSSRNSGRRMNIFPPVHIVVAHSFQLVNYLEDAYRKILQKYGNELPSVISTITGPSRTSDIEKTLVLGAHGPKQLVVFLFNK